MSIEDDQKAIIRLGNIHSWIFKVSLYVAPVFSLWAISTIVRHDTDIAVLKMQISMLGGHAISQSVNVGQTESEAAQLASVRDYLTTADIATQQNVSERAVIDWISTGRIHPQPQKQGKAWVIAKNFRILPQSAEECGEPPQP